MTMQPIELKAGAVQQLSAGSAQARRALHRHARAIAAEFCAEPAARSHRVRLQISRRTKSRRERVGNDHGAFAVGSRRNGSPDSSRFKLSQQLVNYDWVNSPGQFVEQLSAHLWATHQLDAFRAAATSYANRLAKVNPPEPPPIPRLGISIIGQGVTTYNDPLFRKLRPQGVHFTQVKSDERAGDDARRRRGASESASGSVRALVCRWRRGSEIRSCDHLRFVSRARTRASSADHEDALGNRTARHGTRSVAHADGAHEARRHRTCEPSANGNSDPVITRFQLKVLTEASGTQIFATTFAQWTAREALRRAQPVNVAGPLRTAAKTEADERNDFRIGQFARTRSRRLARRRRLRLLLQLLESAAPPRRRPILVRRLV